MTSLTIRKIDPAARIRLRSMAKENGRSMEAQARVILEQATTSVGFGDVLVSAARRFPVTDKQVDFVLAQRDRTPAEPMGLPD